MAITDTINIDFQVFSTGDPKLLIIMDTSTWGLLEDKAAIIEIIPPGSAEERVYSFEKGKNNVFNSSNLLISPIGEYNPLADGVYRISVKGSPDTNCQHRDFLKTDKARLELANIYASLGTDNTDPEVKRVKKIIQDIELLIKTAEILTTRGKLKEAYSRFKEAVRRIKNYNECKECN